MKSVAALLLFVLNLAAGSPVEKVVNLLKDLKVRLQQDEASEQQTYDKYACWCEKTTARKAASIEDAKDDLRSLGQEILGLKGTVARLSAEIQEHTSSIKENEVAQEKATALRQRENAAHMAESAEMKQALAALEKAVMVLKDATAPSAAFLQAGRLEEASRGVRLALAAAPVAALGRLPPTKLALLRTLAAQLARGTGKAAYAPQSASIQGILGDMYDTFSTDLETMTGSEATKNRGFEDFIAAQQEALLLLQEALKEAEKDKAEAEVMFAEATQSYDDTEQQMKADIEFFDATKDSCQAKSGEWSVRKSLREEELKGIADALTILTSDSARELFAKAIKPGIETFLQVSEDGGAAAAPLHAYQALKAHATESHSLRLARLAAQVRTAKSGHFDKVLAAIDTMVGTLQGEEADDIAKRDQCKDEYQEINSTMADLDWKIEVNERTIRKIEALIQRRTQERTRTVEEIQAVQQQMAEMNATRKAENEAFLQAKSEDQQAIELLTQATDVLSAYYANNSIDLGPIQGGEGVGLVQQGPVFDVSEDQAPEATFSGKGKRKGETKGIVSILTMIIQDLGDEVTNAMKDEAAAQLAYEKQLATALQLEASLGTKKTNLDTAIADGKDQKREEGTTKSGNEADRTSEVEYMKSIKPDCDWIIGAFEERRTKRKAEMDGLVQAKEFLAGYQASQEEGGALLQRAPRRFDDRAFSRIHFERLAPA